MDLKVAAVLILIVHTFGSAVPSSDDLHAVPRRPEYHPGMTSMFMMDSQGKIKEVYLTEELGGAGLEMSVEDNVFFYLYTSECNDAYQLYINDTDRLINSTFDPSRPTKVLIHGFDNSYLSYSEQAIKEAYLSDRELNIIAVDWSALCKAPNYFSAVGHVQAVGQRVGLLIDFLVSAGAGVSSFHIIGHSLGAHVSAFAANTVTSGNITRITGLDPALPLFYLRPAKSRLDPTDAEMVDCIHTCGGFLGFYVPLCTHDFYPNGGKPSQPGCGWDIVGDCSHGRSYRYFSSSVTANFTATLCASTKELKKKKCSGKTMGLMGDPAVNSEPGLYYLQTSKSYPYVKV